MRAAAFIAAGIFAAGLYLALAAAMAFTPTWIGLGTLAIAATVGIGLVVGGATANEPGRQRQLGEL